ncbi:MAG: hypothetical protein DI535_04185 [Citrobacter freundii]|nr:MAG: hypothetical protein DI535_04185 [Citrobacter freundii]
MKSTLPLLLFLLSTFFGISQDIAVTIGSDNIVARKYTTERLIIPIEVKFDITPNSAPPAGTLSVPFSVNLSPNDVPVSLAFNALEFAQISWQSDVTSVNFTNMQRSAAAKVYVIIPPALIISTNKSLTLQVLLNYNQVKTKQITIEPASDIVYSLKQYFKQPAVKLDYVSKVEANNNVLTVSGYKDSGFTKRSVLLENNEALAIREWSVIFRDGYLNSAPFSMVTIPFKIRPRAKVTLRKSILPKDTAFGATAMSGISNLGIHMEIIKHTTDRYFATGKKATHKWGFGALLTPGVEELSAGLVKDTSLTGDKKSKQFYISFGLSAFYSYNGISFFVVPAAIDVAPSPQGKQWIYNKKIWWGFGIGLNPTLLAQIFK